MSDYHLHLHDHWPSTEGPAPGTFPLELIEAYVETASRRGVTELGFTEHLYRCIEAVPVLGRFWEEEPRAELAAHSMEFVLEEQNLSLEDYVDAIETAKQRGLPVKLGLEVDFFPRTFDAVMELLAPYPWDYLIGSVHWIGGWSYDSVEVAFEIERRGVDRMWEEYFELETRLAASGAVDVLAHVDVCKKLGYRPAIEPVHLYERVIEAAVATSTGVEVSSQGLRNPVGEVYPSATFLKMFREAGLPITLASDAHVVRDAGFGRQQVVEAARAAGYTHHLRFERRRRTEVPLPAPAR